MASITELSHLESLASKDPFGKGTITRARFELGLHTLAGKRLIMEITTQLWNRLPTEARSAVRHETCEETRKKILKLEKIVFQPGVTNMFVKYKPRIRFNQWRRAKNERRQDSTFNKEQPSTQRND